VVEGAHDWLAPQTFLLLALSAQVWKCSESTHFMVPTEAHDDPPDEPDVDDDPDVDDPEVDDEVDEVEDDP